MLKTKDIRAFMVEFIGTFWIVLITCWSLTAYHQEKLSLLGVAISNGMIIAVCMWAGISKSGAHFNPIITLVRLLLRNNTLTIALGYIISQLLSSFFAALMVVLVIPFDKEDGERIVYYPRVSQNASNIQIFVLEFILSFLYVMMYFATIVDKNAPSNIFGFGVGGVMIIGYLSIGHNTGACINPVRIFGPSVMTGNVYETGILWLANLLGGIFGGFYHDFYLKKYVIEEESDSKIEDEL